MKHLLLALTLALGLVMTLPVSTVAADGWSDSASSGKAGGRGVPELDTTLAGAAMVLLLGGVAYLASRRREDA